MLEFWDPSASDPYETHAKRRDTHVGIVLVCGTVHGNDKRPAAEGLWVGHPTLVRDCCGLPAPFGVDGYGRGNSAGREYN
jgi:hypothetical protein